MNCTSKTSTYALQAGEKVKLLINLDVSSRSVGEISISGYMMTSLIIASWTFKDKSAFVTLLRQFYSGSFYLWHETKRYL